MNKLCKDVFPTISEDIKKAMAQIGTNLGLILICTSVLRILFTNRSTQGGKNLIQERSQSDSCLKPFLLDCKTTFFRIFYIFFMLFFYF